MVNVEFFLLIKIFMPDGIIIKLPTLHMSDSRTFENTTGYMEVVLHCHCSSSYASFICLHGQLYLYGNIIQHLIQQHLNFL